MGVRTWTEEVPRFGMKCDGCQEPFGRSESQADGRVFSDVDAALEAARKAGWRVFGHTLICRRCLEAPDAE